MNEEIIPVPYVPLWSAKGQFYVFNKNQYAFLSFPYACSMPH